MLTMNTAIPNIPEEFAELLKEFYETGITNQELSLKEYFDELTNKLEFMIRQDV